MREVTQDFHGEMDAHRYLGDINEKRGYPKEIVKKQINCV